MRRALLLLLSTALVAVLAAAAPPAWAHTRLVSSTPSQGVPAEAPGAVVLVFSDPVQPGLSAVSVTGADGQEHVDGTPSPGGDPASVSQPLRSPLAPGTYRVAYRVLAADGHPVTGSFEITAVAAPSTAPTPAAGASAAAAAPTPQATTPASQPAAAERDDDGGLPMLPMAVGGLAVAGLAGLVVRRRGGAGPRA